MIFTPGVCTDIAGWDIVVAGLEIVIAGCDITVAGWDTTVEGFWIETTGGRSGCLPPPELRTLGLKFKGGLLASVKVTKGSSSFG